MKELSLPSIIMDGDKAMELARVWIVDNHPTFVLSGSLWDNPAIWGLLLVDFMKHIASAYAEQGKDIQKVLNTILDAFNAELGNPTS